MRECTVHVHALWKPKTEILCYILPGLLFWIATTPMSSLTTQETEECVFPYKGSTYIFGIRIEELHSNKEVMNEIEFSLNDDSFQTHFCCYKYLKSCTRKHFFELNQISLSKCRQALPISMKVYKSTSLPK